MHGPTSVTMKARSGIRLQSLILLFVIYGLQQGLCTSWLIIGRHYYFKDILQLTPSYAQVFVAITWVPLNIKVCITSNIYFSEILSPSSHSME
jgi:hypothetical protein